MLALIATGAFVYDVSSSNNIIQFHKKGYQRQKHNKKMRVCVCVGSGEKK